MKIYGVGLVFWTVVGLIFTGQRHLLAGPEVPFVAVLKQQMLMWYGWGISAPCLAWLDRHLPFYSSHVQRIFSRTLLGIAWAIGFTAILHGSLSNGPLPVLVFVQFSPWYSLIALLILGVYIGGEYYGKAQRRALESAQLTQRLTEARLQVLRTQLNPHFLFNTLNTISSFIENEPRRARLMMEHLGTLLRHSLESGNKTVITLEQELSHLAPYIEILKARFEEGLTFSATSNAEANKVMVPPFILQPLVENAVKHGLSGRHAEERLWIHAEVVDDRIVLSVTDNGIGLPETWSFAQNAGLGLNNVRARLQELYGEDYYLACEGGVGGGTVVHLMLPLRPVEDLEEMHRLKQPQHMYRRGSFGTVFNDSSEKL